MSAGTERTRAFAEGTSPRISLEGDLSLKDARRLCEHLRKTIDASQYLEIDMQDLTGLDISIVQLLISARKYAEQRCKKVTLVTSPDGLLPATLTRAGLLAAGKNNIESEDFWLGAAQEEEDNRGNK